MTTPVAAPVLVYNRIEQNHRKTILLVIVAVLLTIPFVLGMSFAVAEGITWQASRQSHLNRFHELRMRRLQAGYDDIAHHRVSPRDLRKSMDRDLRADLRAANEYTGDEKTMRLEILLVLTAGLLAVLGLLVWGFASSPTSKLLVMCGARPAGNEEREAQRILENLSIGAGIPTPRLYVIESMSLNAFAAGMTPQTAVIAVTHGLLALLNQRELEGVLAHELSHIGNHDTRLNVMVASFALFLRMPYLLRRRYVRARRGPYIRMGYSVALIPVFIYVFLIAPLLAAMVRSAISRSREFLADADAALLTRYPEGLMRALAKIAGAGSAVAACNPALSHLYFADPSLPGSEVSLFSGELFATHPPIDQRVARLVEFGGPACAAAIETAVAAGRDFTREHPPLPMNDGATASSGDEAAMAITGNPLGRVFRVVSDGTPIYDRDNTGSLVLTQANKGDLLVVFDDPGKMRQVITSTQTFGYIPFAVKLQREDIMPAEIHNANARSAAADPEPPSPEPQIVLPATVSRTGLTAQQIAFCAGFAILVFAGMLIALLQFGGR
jgi:heat shock protein HtpX